jgi:glucose-6-phosphate 1-dehydrogenase
MRRDEADAAWRWCQPVLDHWAAEQTAPIGHAAGSWGPPASSRLTAIADTAWHEAEHLGDDHEHCSTGKQD